MKNKRTEKDYKKTPKSLLFVKMKDLEVYKWKYMKDIFRWHFNHYVKTMRDFGAIDQSQLQHYFAREVYSKL